MTGRGQSIRSPGINAVCSRVSGRCFAKNFRATAVSRTGFRVRPGARGWESILLFTNESSDRVHLIPLILLHVSIDTISEIL